jgi:hypothetical protein
MGVPIVLIDLITIYDDDEGLKASRISPVLITQEEEPGEVSAPAPDEIVPKSQEGDLEDKITTNIVYFNPLGT